MREYHKPAWGRGGSEGGITPGLAVIANAIGDARSELGIEHIEPPATPERIWKVIQISHRQSD